MWTQLTSTHLQQSRRNLSKLHLGSQDCNCFIRWVLILSQICSPPMLGQQSDNIRRSILKHSFYLKESGIHKRKFRVARIHIHCVVSPDSDVRSMLKNLRDAFGNLWCIWQCPVSRQNHKKICFNSGPISLRWLHPSPRVLMMDKRVTARQTVNPCVRRT